MRDLIRKSLQQVTGQENINLDVPVDSFGDYSTNIAMQLKTNDSRLITNKNNSKSHQSDVISKSMSPREVAEELKILLEKDEEVMEVIEKIEVAGPGFINFYLSQKALVKELQFVNTRSERYGVLDSKDAKIMFEFGQPNTHKLPHIGHLYSYVYGCAMTNILEAAGYTLYRVNYQGDIGPHVAKCLWALQKNKEEMPEELEKKAFLLQKMYQEGSQSYDEDETAKSEINEINKMIYRKDPEIYELWKKTREWSLDYDQQFEKRLSVTYDRYYFESEVFQKGIEIVTANTPKVFKESQEAIIFDGSNYGLHDRVFVTKNKTATYEAKDLALEKLKMEEWPADLLVITTANEQNEYFKVVFKALVILDPSFEHKLKHIGFGMVNLTTGKMSSRTGKIIGAIDLVDMTVDAVKNLSKNSEVDVSEAVGVGAVKYSFLKSNPLQNISFNLEESISVEGNSGPYVQYTYARTQSVLSKLTTQNSQLKTQESWVISHELNLEESDILRHLVHFSEIIEDSANNYAPNLLCNYLYELAQRYNTFYAKHRIIGEENETFRIEMTKAVGIVIKNGLNLLGIKTPEKM